MSDAVFIVASIAFFALTLVYVLACEHLSQESR